MKIRRKVRRSVMDDIDSFYALLDIDELQNAGLIELTLGSIDAQKAAEQIEVLKARGQKRDQLRVAAWSFFLIERLGVVLTSARRIENEETIQ